MQRIAVPMIGGMVSSTLLTLVVSPAIFGVVNDFRLPSNDRHDREPPATTKRVPVPEPAE
jgi:Cu(I)/Ag(I) efflux system membrane protein CusA/SilA